MLDIFDSVVDRKPITLGELGRSSIRALTRAFEIKEPNFLKSSDLGIGGESSQRLSDITSNLSGDIYLTGLGALNYLDENTFLAKDISVMCMKYSFAAWNQFYGPFTPYVSALDCLAHCGGGTLKYLLQSIAVSWQYAIDNQEFLKP